MKKMIKIMSAFLIIAAASFVYYGCSCNCGAVEETDVPDNVMKNANELIISKTGQDFFEKYITIDLRRSKYMSPDYFLVYRMIMPEKPYVNETIEFTVDAEGNVNNEFPVKGLPDCSNGGCDFAVDEEQAINIAKDAGLKEGIKEWQAIFGWDERKQMYTWHVLSTLSEGEGERTKGEQVIIDGNTGEVIDQTEWVLKD